MSRPATGGQTGQVVKKTINAGTYYTHAITTGTTYGFAFEPLGTGTTTVTVTAPGARDDDHHAACGRCRSRPR